MDDWVTSEWGKDVATYLAHKGRDVNEKFINEIFWLDEVFGIRR